MWDNLSLDRLPELFSWIPFEAILLTCTICQYCGWKRQKQKYSENNFCAFMDLVGLLNIWLCQISQSANSLLPKVRLLNSLFNFLKWFHWILLNFILANVFLGVVTPCGCTCTFPREGGWATGVGRFSSIKLNSSILTENLFAGKTSQKKWH
jgi:hypothetical protein